ncbi:MAG: hypothetical protein ACRBB3_05140 [Alphaproteobacteria bacterium]
MTVQPYFFDNNVFDDEDTASLSSEEAAEFTKSQMESMQREAFEKGKKEGFAESETSINKNILSTLQKIERDMSILFAAEHDRSAKYEEEAVNLVLNIMQKSFPLYMKEYGDKELKSAIEDILSSHNTPEKIQIDLPPSLMTSLEQSIKNMEVTLDKHISLKSNESLQEFECRISWPDGGIICNHSLIADKTISIMKEALAERGVNVHDEDSSNNETTSDNKTAKSDRLSQENTAGET